jgi:putative transposase
MLRLPQQLGLFRIRRRAVELVFDPFDLTDIEVRYKQRPFGKAIAFRIGRHATPRRAPISTDRDRLPTAITEVTTE